MFSLRQFTEMHQRHDGSYKSNVNPSGVGGHPSSTPWKQEDDKEYLAKIHCTRSACE